MVNGFVAVLDLTRASAEDIAADPGARAAWAYASGTVRLDQPRPSPNLGSSSTGTPTGARPLHSTPWRSWRCRRYPETPNLAWDFLRWPTPSDGTPTSRQPTSHARRVPTSGSTAADTGCSPTTSDRSP